MEIQHGLTRLVLKSLHQKALGSYWFQFPTPKLDLKAWQFQPTSFWEEVSSWRPHPLVTWWVGNIYIHMDNV